MQANDSNKWPGLTPMAKVEVVVDGEFVPNVRDLLVSAGATGYTALHGVSGYGHHGEHEGRLLFNDRNSLSLLISVVPIERVDELVAGIRRVLKATAGVMFVSETHVSRPEYFMPSEEPG